MIISISGVPGSGKTSAGKIVAEKLGFKFYSVGGIFRQVADKRGITIDALMKLGEEDEVIHTEIDDYQKNLGLIENQFVIEGRLSWFFIPQSFKILLLCSSHEAARRIYEAKKNLSVERSNELRYASIEEAERALVARNASDILGYKKHYGLDYRDPSHFDLVIDTTEFDGPEKTADQILAKIPTTHP